ncbi:GH36 C-terminal domain-containing protein [Leifsonia poae]|uniref:GH36 C-terminal domain-containing protein n=1 Tax=Leifsonia poae TaxID=110933 RepID=UPI003D679E07
MDAHKRFRGLLHSARVVQADTIAELRVGGVVSHDRSEALYSYTVLDRPAAWPPPRFRMPGLDPGRRYRVRSLTPGDPVPDGQRPPWMSGEVTVSGAVLATIGLEPPSLDPDRSALFHVVEA